MAQKVKRAKNSIILKSLLAISLLAMLLCLLFACDKGSGDGRPGAVLGDDFKREYYVGQSFEPGGTLALYRGDTFVSFETVTEDMVSGFDTSSARDIIVTVAYGEYKTTTVISVLALTAVSLTLDQDTLPTEVYEGQPFPAGTTFTARMSDNTVRRDIAVTQGMLGGFDPSRTGAQTVTVSYYEASATFLIRVVADEKKRIVRLINMPTTYFVNDALSIEDAKIEVEYKSSKTDLVSVSADMVQGFTTAHGGNVTTAKVCYGALEIDYPYFVQHRAISLSLKENTLPSSYEKDAANTLPEGGVALVTYDDGEQGEVSLTSENFVGFTRSAAGQKTCTVKVDLATESYSYTVLRDITSMTASGYTPYVVLGGGFDEKGELTVVYEDGAWEVFSLKDDAVSVVYTDEVGDAVAQKVSFRGKECVFYVCIYPESESQTVSSVSVQGAFHQVREDDQDAIAKMIEGVTVVVTYKYTGTKSYPCSAQWISVDLETPVTGDKERRTVTVCVGGVNAEQDEGEEGSGLGVDVLSKQYAERVTSLEVTGVKSTCAIGAPLSALITGAKMRARYGGGYFTKSNIPLVEECVTEFSSEEADPMERYLTVTYEGCSVQVPYRVITEEERNSVTGVDLYDFRPLLFVGDGVDQIDPTGYEITVTYGYGDHTGKIPLELSMLSCEPFAEDGLNPVTLRYQGAESIVYVSVHSAESKTMVTSIEVTPKTVYSYVGVEPDLSAVELIVTYGYGRTVSRLPLSQTTLGAYTVTETGTQSVPVSYEGATCTLYLSFASGESGNVMQRVEIDSSSRVSFTQGECEDGEPDGVYLAVYYIGRSEPEAVPVTKAMISGFSTDIVGEVFQATVTYGGEHVFFSYSVTAQQEE